MDEDTTTPAPVDTGADNAQPVDTVETVAATDTVEVTENKTNEPTEERTDAQPSDEAELQDWASKKGLTLDSENATKAAKMAREAERAMHQKAQKASELERAMQPVSDQVAEDVATQTGQDPEVLKRLQRMEVQGAVRDFWDSNPDARNFESQMVDLVQTKPHLAGDLDALYATAVMQSGKLDTVKSQGGREALQSLAHKQQAAVPKGHATTSSTTPPKKNFGDMSIPEMEAHLGKVRR